MYRNRNPYMMIAVAQIDALYYPKDYTESPDEDRAKNFREWASEYRYEFISPEGDSIAWDIGDTVDDYYPAGFMEVVDGDWEDNGEMVYEEVVKRIKVHPNLRIKEGMIISRDTGKYRSPEPSDYPLYVRFPVVLRADFDYDSYNGEVDCSYWIEGVPDLYHLEDLIPEEKPEEQ